MATDVYLQLDGIKGESQDERHLGWIKCLTVNWALTQPKSATVGCGRSHCGAGRTHADHFHEARQPVIADAAKALRRRQNDPESEVRIHARRWPGCANQILSDPAASAAT